MKLETFAIVIYAVYNFICQSTKTFWSQMELLHQVVFLDFKFVRIDCPPCKSVKLSISQHCTNTVCWRFNN